MGFAEKMTISSTGLITPHPLEGQYSAWANDEPNNHDEKCVQMYGKGPNEGKWNDESCSMDAKFSDSAPVALCQKAIS